MNHKTPGTLFAFFLLLLCVALTGLLITGEDYYTFASGAIEGAAGAATLDKADLEKLTHPAATKLNTEIKFRNFFITIPGAKEVELQADFNSWGKNPLPLKAYAKGYFETSVALAAGEYKYVFVVDGKDVLDPMNLDRTTVDGRTVCIKTVK